MSSVSPALRGFAGRLIALEATRAGATSGATGADRVCEKLRGPLSKLAGNAGFRSLFTRALALAKSEHSALDAVQVLPDGRLDGIEKLPPDCVGECGELVVAQLLTLLMTFIGEPLTLRLVGDAWPETSFTAMPAESGGKS